MDTVMINNFSIDLPDDLNQHSRIIPKALERFVKPLETSSIAGSFGYPIICPTMKRNPVLYYISRVDPLPPHSILDLRDYHSGFPHLTLTDDPLYFQLLKF
jgi:hypothetical protein